MDKERRRRAPTSEEQEQALISSFTSGVQRYVKNLQLLNSLAHSKAVSDASRDTFGQQIRAENAGLLQEFGKRESIGDPLEMQQVAMWGSWQNRKVSQVGNGQTK